MGKKVLIVNYEPKRLARLNQLILDLGYESVTAKNGTEALDAVDNFVPDLAVIDPMLPKVSGFEVAQRLTSDHPGLPIIMVTSVYKGNRYRTEAITKYGVKEYLEEPFEDETLQALVKKYLELSEPPKMPKKKASARRRLEEILEETMSGKVPGAKTVSHKPKASKEPALTSSDIFSDVIKDVEEAPGDMAAIAEKEKAKAKAQEKQVVAEKEAVVESSLKEQKAPAEPKEESKPKPEPKPVEAPEVKKREVEVKSEAPEPRKGRAEEKGKKKGKKSEGIEYGSYVLLEKVATGGMAELFKAKRRGVQGFQKIVAIKRILSHLVDNEEFVTMFIDEAKLAAQLNHPNIAQIYDLGKIENSFYIAMEYVEGYDLRNILKECKKRNIRVPEPLVLFIASKMLSALDYAHRKKGLDMKDLKIVHRDISPQNILISKGGDVKLVDFGIAKAATKASQTQAGALKGKLLYMSPEQAYGKPIDNRSDLFSLASVIYESITGKKCFLADSEISILEKVRKVQYTPIREINPDVSKGTEKLIRQAFSKKIEDRFQSAKEMESELHTLMESLPFAINERILAQFVNALYEGDLQTIEDISKRFTVKEDVAPEKVEAPVQEEEPAEQKPEPVSAVSMDDLEGNVDANETIKMDSGTMIMPDLEDVEKHEDEMLEQFSGGSGGNKTGLIVAVVVVAIILAVAGYFTLMRKAAPAKQVKKETAQSTVTTPETSTVATGKPETVAQPEEQKAVSQTPVTPADLGIDKDKLVQQLVQKKLAEADARQKKVKKAKKPIVKPAPKPVQGKPVVVEKKTVVKSPAVAESVKSETNAPTTKPAETKTAETKTTDLTTTTTQLETKDTTAVNESAISPARETKPAESEATVEKPAPKPVETKPIPQPIVPKVKEGDLVPLIKGKVIFPTPVKTVKARMTVIDRRRNLHGEVLVQGLIDENGNVVPEEVRVLRNTVKVRNNLGKMAMKAFKKWKFTPAMKDGVRVKVYFTHMFVF
ncbi:MAG: hypothetical protein DRJ14_08815 [Acidobacteria bacterium]|nr:MAG: hypothetical protein DRJ14_08815 [Acidobacteriota bacterium]